MATREPNFSSYPGVSHLPLVTASVTLASMSGLALRRSSSVSWSKGLADSMLERVASRSPSSFWMVAAVSLALERALASKASMVLSCLEVS